MATQAAPSYQELFDLGRAEAALKRPDLTFDEGDISEMIVAGIAAMADHLAQYAAARFKATTVDGASGDDLVALADDRWQIQAKAAAPGRGTAHFARPNASGGAGQLDAGTVVATTRDSQGNDVRFTLDADLAWGGSDLTKDAAVTCSATGKTGNIAAGQLSRFIATPFDATIVVSNVADFAGGADAQDDPSLREEIRSFPDALRRATLDAIEYGAKLVPGVEVAIAVEEIVNDQPTGIVNLYVSDADGGHTDPMVSDVVAIMSAWKPAGCIVNVTGGEKYVSSISISLTLKTGMTDATTQALKNNVAAAIVSEVNKLRVGEKLYHAMIIAAARDVDPDAIRNVTVSAPADGADPPSAHQLIRIAASDITITTA